MAWTHFVWDSHSVIWNLNKIWHVTRSLLKEYGISHFSIMNGLRRRATESCWWMNIATLTHTSTCTQRKKQFVIWQVCIFKYLYIIYTEGGLVRFWGQLVRSSSSPLDLSHSKKSFTFIFTTPFPTMSSGDPSRRSHSKKLSSEIMSSS